MNQILVYGELENKLRIRGEALWDIGCNLHGIFSHPGKFEDCSNQNCSAVRSILDKTDPKDKFIRKP